MDGKRMLKFIKATGMRLVSCVSGVLMLAAQALINHSLLTSMFNICDCVS
jgi:hypothetical protein